MNGKVKCGVLKSIRRDIAKANGIKLDIPECTHVGECAGTCPRCEAEVKYLETALAERRRRGLKVAVAGVSAGLVALNAASCDPVDRISDLINGGRTAGDMMVDTTAFEGEVVSPDTEIVLDGDIAFVPETQTVTDVAAGDISADPETFDETLQYDLLPTAGVMPYMPPEEDGTASEEAK